MVNRYDVETGLEMGGGAAGGISLGSSLAETFLGPTLGWGLGGAVGLGSMAMSLAARHKRREAYKENKAAIEKAHEMNVKRMARTHAMQRQALSSGQKGIGGGHLVGQDRAGTVQRQAVTQQKEIAGLETEAELLATRAAHARNKAREGAGGSQSALESMLRIGMAISSMIPKASPKFAPHPTQGGWDEYRVPFGWSD